MILIMEGRRDCWVEDPGGSSWLFNSYLALCFAVL